MIEVCRLEKKYASRTAVKDLTFTFEDGKIYGLLGPNGAGKSTTMNMLTGYLCMTDGEVRIDGYDLLREPEKAKACVGYLPEIPPLYPELTVREYLTCAAGMKGIKGKALGREVHRVMQAVGIEDRENQLIRQLSKGYGQRVGIAQALLGPATNLILDEPTVGLDPVQLKEIRALFKSLKKDHTVIISSHILSEIAEICDEMLILKNGCLAASGTAVELQEKARGVRKMEILAEGTKEEMTRILERIPGISGFRVEEEPDTGGGRRAALRLDGEADIRRELFFAFADAGCAMLEMGPVTRSLEEIFVELTADRQH